MENPYVELCLSVQAARRALEGVRTPLAPAMGVAASLYTHQLANVHRVLTDIRVRHLLADEVGLGKTVQALMVLNALRAQRPELRALIIVPDELVTQWRDEILTRAHAAPLEGGAAPTAHQYIHLAWEALIKAGEFSLAQLDPARFDVLIVDELHRLRADTQDKIVREAAAFEHLLILTATPSFQRPARHAQLFALLEPARAELARAHVAARADGLSEGDDLSRWPAEAAQAVVDYFLEADRAAAAGDDRVEVALARCAYRRVIRTRRVDFRGVLPARGHTPIVVEPLDAEAKRQALMWRYFEHLDELTRRFDPVLLAKRVVLSPPSLEQRVDFLRRKGHDRGDILAQVKPLVSRRNGDSKLDALVDLLASIWREDPTERVLVAAQDNLTVDYLFEAISARLPLIGPLDARVELIAARVRQGMTTEAVSDVAGRGNETNENIEAFQRGEAQVLFAPEAAQVGLNLQCARVIVLYSVPWRPEEVEQWIGRLDRIGNAAAFDADGGARTIDVYTITQRGLVDERVVAVLKSFGVFERGVNLDGAHLEAVAEGIEVAALGGDEGSWRGLEDATARMGDEDELNELRSALRARLPWTAAQARGLRDRMDALAPVSPVICALPAHAVRGPRAWDRALEGTLKLLARAGEYSTRALKDEETGQRFRTLWYTFGERGMGGRRAVTSRVLFSFGADPSKERSFKHAHAFITRRGDVASPPHRCVKMEPDEKPKPLRFLGFGQPLHDELIEGWAPKPGPLSLMSVGFFEDHALFDLEVAGLYFLRVTQLDPAALLDGVNEDALCAILEATPMDVGERVVALALSFKAVIRCALEADARWLRDQLPARLRLDARRRARGAWVSIDDEATRALLDPLAHGRQGLPRARRLEPREVDLGSLEAALQRACDEDQRASRDAWGALFPEFSAALKARLFVIEEEARDAVAAARLELERADAALGVARSRGNRAQITRAENAQVIAAARVAATDAYWRQRARWLAGCEAGARDLKPTALLTAGILARVIK